MSGDRVGVRVRKTLIAAGVLASLLVAALTAVAVGSARADSFTWLGPTSVISTGGASALSTVSCPSTSQCTTVDAKGEQITFTPGTGAAISRTAVDTIGAVSSLSCPATNQCTAVDDGGNEITFSPSSGHVNSAGRKNVDLARRLTAVSCASDTSCVAVDDHGQAAAFDPSSGRVLGGPATIDGTTPLTGISCPQSNSACTAVDNAGHQVTFSVDQTGAVTTTSSGAIDGTTALTSVSCPDGTVCSAVDGSGDEITFTPSSGTVIGTTTQIDTNAGHAVALNSVSCPSSSTCVAVDTLGNEITFAPAATPAASASSVDGTTYLAAVSCPAGADSCTAVDNRNAEVTFPTSGASSSRHVVVAPRLAGVSCPTRTQCTAVASGASEVTLDPTTGTVNSAGVSPVDTSGNQLTAVSCISASLCTAVDSGGNEVTFDPTTGQKVANGFISVDSTELRSVACLASGTGPQCTAVDSAGNEITFDPQTSSFTNNVGLYPVDPSPSHALESVSCPAANQCTAVDAGGNEVTFNPQTGQYYTTQQYVTVDPGQQLTSVACPTTGQCTGVDEAGGVITFLSPAGQSAPLAPPRQTIELGAVALNSVACPSAAQCTAVDDLGQEATFSPSSSSLSPRLLTPLAGANAVPAVSCQSESICAAVDAEGNAFAGVVPPVATAAPTISGTPQEGRQLSESNGSWTNVPTGYSYAWQDCDSATDPGTCSPIAGATSPSYAVTAGDVGNYIRVQEIAANAGGPGQASLSAATAQVTPAVPTNATPPTIAGLAQQGQQLTVQPGSWSEDVPAPLTYAYQWETCDASGAGCTPIAGATSSAFTPTTSEVGHRLLAVETASNSGGSGNPATSATSAIVAAAPAPPIQAVSNPATGIRANAATLGAQLATQGLAVTWQFVYGTTTNYTAQTPAQTIPAGSTTVAVSSALGGLKPGTTYHYRVVETSSPTPYLPGTTVDGQDATFRTSPIGTIALSRRTLTVSGRRVAVPLQCKSTLACSLRFSLATTKRVGAGRTRHLTSVLCATRVTRLAAGRNQDVRVGLSKTCLALLQAAPRRRLVATLTTRPRSGQPRLVRKVTLTAPTRNRRPRRG